MDKPTKITFKHRGSDYIKVKPTIKERGACVGCAFHTNDVLDMTIADDDPCKHCNFSANVNNYMDFIWKKFTFKQKIKFKIAKIRYFLYNLFE